MSANAAALLTLRDVVERNARLHADDLHLIFGDRRSTFRQFAERSFQLAGALHDLGVRAQDRVAVLAMNCPQYLEIYGACEVAPFIAAPVNFRLAAPEIEFVLRDAAPRVLILERQYLPVVETLRARLAGIEHYLVIDGAGLPNFRCYEEVLASGSVQGPPLRPSPADIHAVMYTSGTTGRPQGAMLSHRGMLALYQTWAYELAADLGDRILLCMPFFHIGARSQGGAVTFRGGTLVVHRAFDAREIVNTVERERITQLHLA